MHKQGSTADSWANLYSRLLSEFRGVDVRAYPHSARHMLVTALSKAGVPQNVIKEFMHWDSLEMVSIYDDNDATDRFGDFFTLDGIKGAQGKELSEL